MNEMMGRLVGLVGLVLTIVALWLDTFSDGSAYWDDGTQGAFLLVVAGIAGLLVVWGWLQNRAQPVRIALGLSFLLLGYYLFVIAFAAFGNWDQLEAGAWLAFAGAIVAVFGTWWGSASIGTATIRPSAMGARGVQLGVLMGLAGIVLCVVAIWLDAADIGLSYWDFSEDKMVGVVMLVVAALTGLALLATWMGRGETAALWASLFAFALLGLYAILPVVSAFGDFGSLDVGAWLGLVGGVAAACGAQLAHMATARAMPATATPAPAA